ncbi:MAG: ABC transporter permease [archaeon YNP-LCB-003-016]|uniref:ABC transporter permease n=1 Tax=Candidatus Culexarchaeum yellowstonense TaxID=2928963 RepID=UPI0026EACE3C|nr:ABC transporter permease [Candidatus Culexarchaeum yellowstonense]MCR6692082.1 ABC transporter permease [Candidatus Culexarchaeum yellowstonense]
MELRNYILRRLLICIPTFLVSSMIIFSLMHIAPGDPIEIMYRGTRPTNPKIIELIREKLGLDKPIYEQYFIWILNFLKGDLGYSYVNNQPVIEQIAARLWLTVELVLLSQVLSLLMGIVLGVVAAVKRNSWVDSLLSLSSLFGYSMPSFWMAILFILIFAITFKWFPVCGSQTIGVELDFWGALADHLWHLTLPLLVLSFGSAAWYFRLVRSAMLDVLQMDYIKTARAKGLTERIVIYKHALRNAILPVATSFGTSLGFVLGGAVVVESIFAWPGLGEFAYKSTLARDYPSIMGINMMIVLCVLIANLITDIVIALIDPRIRY